MTLLELRGKLNKLPETIIGDLTEKEYLPKLAEEFMKIINEFSANSDSKKAFNQFEGLKDTSEKEIEKFVEEVKEKIEGFNNICLKCLRPDSKPKDFEDFIDVFFDKNGKCKDKKIMTECIDGGTDFFRIRGTHSNNKYEIFDRKGMYMMDPEFSAKVGTARFNLSGYPCLYLAESLYLAWEECRRPDFHTANFARFRNRRNLIVLNLVIPEASKLNSVIAFFRTYLSLVCRVKAKDDEKDHWQYRVSNLFIKMIYQLDDKHIDGIKYMSSKRFENTNFKMEYTKECAVYVFPPKSIENKHCEQLASMFEMTESYSYFYFKIYGRNYISPRIAATRNYDETIFSFIESLLKLEETSPCKKIISPDM